VAGVEYTTWQEAVEREIVVRPIAIGSDPAARCVPIVVDAGTSYETLMDAAGKPAGVIVRSWDKLVGAVDVWTDPVAPGLCKMRVDIANCSFWLREPREQVLYRTFVSTHTVLRAHGDASFVSQIDPPARWAAAASRCKSVGTFPVLAGEAPARNTMLSSPIILYDYPEVAEQSPGDFFDGGEIDQLLVLSVLSMTADEQRRMRATDPKAREILDRCQRLSPEAMLRLHGVNREVRSAEARP
jgi:hypothetical protein